MRPNAPTGKEDAQYIEARCRHLRPEALMPADMPLPPHGTADPRNVAHKMVVPVETRQSVREADTRQHERHELRLSPSDATGRHELSLRVVSQPDAQSGGSAERPGGATGAGENGPPATQITFHTHGLQNAHALMRQWQETHKSEQLSRQRQMQSQAAAQHAGGGHGGHGGSRAERYQQAAAALAHSQAQAHGGRPNSRGPPHMPSSMAASFGLSAEDLNSHAGLASPMGLGQAVGGSMPVPRGRSPMGAHAGRPGQPGNAAQQQYFGQWKQ